MIAKEFFERNARSTYYREFHIKLFKWSRICKHNKKYFTIAKKSLQFQLNVTISIS